MLTWEERRKAAETEAWRRHGAEHRGLIVGLAYVGAILPWAALAALIGGVGYAGWWLWQQMTSVVAQQQAVATAPLLNPAGVPTWVWLAMAGTTLALLWSLRPQPFPSPGLTVVKVGAALMVLAGLAAYALASAT